MNTTRGHQVATENSKGSKKVIAKWFKGQPEKFRLDTILTAKRILAEGFAHERRKTRDTTTSETVYLKTST